MRTLEEIRAYADIPTMVGKPRRLGKDVLLLLRALELAANELAHYEAAEAEEGLVCPAEDLMDELIRRAQEDKP